MKTGLLWQDHDVETPHGIARAVAAYRRKHGEMPTTCAVNEAQRGDLERVGTVRVIGLPTVLQGHYWVGRDDEHKKPTL